MNRESKKGMFKRTFDIYRSFRIPWPLYILAVVLGIVSSRVSLLAIPYTSAIQAGDITAPNALSGYLIFTVLTMVVGLLPNIPAFYAEAASTQRLQDRMIQHSTRLSMSAYERNASRLVSWVTQDSAAAHMMLTYAFGLITGIVTAIMSVSSMSTINVGLGWILPAAIALVLFTYWLAGRLYFPQERMSRRNIAEMTAYLSEHLSFYGQVKQLHSEEEEIQRGRAATRRYFLTECKQNILFQIAGLLEFSVDSTLPILVLALGASAVRSGAVSMPDLIAYQNYVFLAYVSLSTIPAIYPRWMGYNGTLFYIAGLNAEPEEVYERQRSMDVEDQDLTFDGVSFGYGDQPVLQNASFTIPKGKLTMLVGPNGSGKTTVFKLIERFYTPTTGSIHFGPYPAEDIHLQEWRQSFAYVLQEPQLFDGTIRENLVYGMDREVSDKEVSNAARLACAEEFIQELPGGYDFVIGQNGCRLSAGQRQRLAIARAVMLDPAYLLLDEATCNLDVYSEQAVTTALLRLMEGRTTVMISHNMDMLRRADHVVVLNGGVVEASGTREDVQRQSPTLQALVQAAVE